MQYLFPLLAVFIWAGNTVVSKLAVGIIQPAEIGFFRWLLVGLALTPFMLGPVLRNRRYILANLGKFVVLGLLGMAVYQSLAYYAAALTSATNMGIILSLMPLMSLGLASSILAHRLNAGALLGALVSLAGVVLVISQGHLGALLEHGVNLGDGCRPSRAEPDGAVLQPAADHHRLHRHPGARRAPDRPSPGRRRADPGRGPSGRVLAAPPGPPALGNLLISRQLPRDYGARRRRYWLS